MLLSHLHNSLHNSHLHNSMVSSRDVVKLSVVDSISTSVATTPVRGLADRTSMLLHISMLLRHSILLRHLHNSMLLRESVVSSRDVVQLSVVDSISTSVAATPLCDLAARTSSCFFKYKLLISVVYCLGTHFTLIHLHI
ncbi:hypothetical protein OIU76_022941 [Salix suchowensis]|nr:hypothetical protein OIU76_022941 [Salix suchowensis]